MSSYGQIFSLISFLQKLKNSLKRLQLLSGKEKKTKKIEDNLPVIDISEYEEIDDYEEENDYEDNVEEKQDLIERELYVEDNKKNESTDNAVIISEYSLAKK